MEICEYYLDSRIVSFLDGELIVEVFVRRSRDDFVCGYRRLLLKLFV